MLVRLVRLVGRLVVGFVVWLILEILVLVSAAPYGGGDPTLIVLFQLATLLIPVWIAMAFVSRSQTRSPPDETQWARRFGRRSTPTNDACT